MPVVVTHQKVATLPDEPGAEVNAGEWNANHTITGLATVASSGLYSDLTGLPTSMVPPDGDKGDITVSSSGTAWAVDAQAITYAKIQNVSATDKLLGRSTAGAGVVEEITCTAAGRALIDDADATAQRATLALGAWAQVASGTGPITISGAGVSSITAQTGTGTTFAMQTAPSFLGQVALDVGTQAAPSVSWTAQASLGFWRSAADVITLSSNTGVNPQLRFLGSDTRGATFGCGPASGLDLAGATLRILAAGGSATARLQALSANAATFYWALYDENAQDVLALRRGTNAQTYRVYGTFTDTSNYVRASLACSATAVTLAGETAGTGADDINIVLTPAGVGTVQVPTMAAGTSSVAAASTAYAMSAAPNASYRVILDSSGSLTAASAAATYAIGQSIPLQVSGTGTAAPPNTIYIAAADFPTVNGLAPKLKVRAQVFCNDVAPGVTFTFGLHPVTRPATSGAAGLVIYTVGAAVASSTGAIATPAVDSSNVIASSDFALPADGHYVLGCVTSGASLAASSHVHISVALQLRNA